MYGLGASVESTLILLDWGHRPGKYGVKGLTELHFFIQRKSMDVVRSTCSHRNYII